MKGKRERQLPTNQGVPVTSNQSSPTVADRGPVLMQDVNLIEKLAHCDRERIRMQVVHAKEAGAQFQCSGRRPLVGFHLTYSRIYRHVSLIVKNALPS